MMENWAFLTTLDGSSNENQHGRHPHSLYSRDSTQELQEIPQEDQMDNLNDIKLEVKEEAGDPFVGNDDRGTLDEMPLSTESGNFKPVEDEDGLVGIKQEEFPMEISRDGSNNTQERYPNPLHFQAFSEEPQEIPQDSQDENMIDTEVKDEAEDRYVIGDDKLCKEEEIPPEISTYSRDTKNSQRDIKDEEKGDMRIKDEEILPEISAGGNNIEVEIFPCSQDSQFFTERAELISESHPGQKTFPCPKCGRCFNERAKLMVHERNHKEQKPFSCYQCDLWFSDKSYLLSHLKIHTGDMHSCAECGDLFTDESYLLRHQRVHKRKVVSCSQSKKSFAKESTPNKHKNVHTDKKPHVCHTCGKGYAQKHSLTVHQYQHQKGLFCLVCGKRSVSNDLVLRHHEVELNVTNDDQSKEEEISTDSKDTRETRGDIKDEEPEKEHVGIKEEEIPMEIGRDASNNENTSGRCPSPLHFHASPEEHQEIPQDAQNENRIGKEVKDEAQDLPVRGDEPCKEEEVPSEISTGESTIKVETFPCSKCIQSFTKEEELISHQKIHTEEKMYPCPECGRRFNEKAKLLVHKMKHTEKKPFTCSQCGLSFSDQSYLLSHQKIHTGDLYTCAECGDIFTEESYLLRHQRAHTGKKVFCCLECGKSFSMELTLKKHKLVHQGEKPYPCDICGKSFQWKRSRTIHLYKHQKRFSCSICGKSFISNYSALRHQKTHSVEGPFTCSECGKGFVDKSLLRAHWKSHPELEMKMYACSDCGQCFGRKAELFTHQRFHTAKTPHTCSFCGRCFINKSLLLRHQSRLGSEMVFVCSECGKSFPGRSCLMYHRSQHTDGKPAK
ncbi:uncharacterized protein [Pyxicephalus adspersus]|uniref:uncharacterized protein isoform X2 n=1 Tax=Pyxicephalus adspersus TaxID=30357 RepID=UPI003B5C40D5